MMVFDDIAKRKIRFQTRRGLLELDLIFGRFMEKEFEHLSDKELSEFSEILEFQDQELLALINGHSATDKEHLIPMLEKIRRASSIGNPPVYRRISRIRRSSENKDRAA